MNDLFNRKDILTIATADKAVIGTRGYFGDNLSNLIEKVRQGKVETLTDVMPDEAYCFERNNNDDSYYIFFLPEDKVKKKVKEPVYRPIKTIDELFNFLIPAFDADTYNTYKKVDVTLLKTYELKDKLTGNICFKRFSQIYISDKYIRLDGCNLEFLFKMYEIKKDGKFVPFGILEK